MLSLILLTFIGQTAGAEKPPLHKYHISCPQGHPIEVWGWKEGDEILGRFRLKNPAPAAPIKNYGVGTDKFPHVKPGQSWYGGNTSYRPAVGASGEVPNRVHLTIIGSQVERDAARKDLEANPEYRRIAEAMGDNLAVQTYGPENPLVAKVGLVDGGKPDIVIQQTKGGAVLYRAHAYPGSDRIVAEIRRADPKYNPANDPGEGFSLDLSKLFENPKLIETVVGGIVILLVIVGVIKGKI